MNVHEMFPSKYVAAADLQERDVDVVITACGLEEMQDKEVCPVLYFAGRKKGMVLNKTNATTIANLYGDETDGWVGKPITLFATQTEFGGKAVACIRVRIHAPSAPAQPSLESAVVPQPQPVTHGVPQPSASPQF